MLYLNSLSKFCLAGIAALIFFKPTTNACTRILLAEPGKAVLVGNNMDWVEDMQTNLVVYPRGLTRPNMVTGQALKWTSKYGSIVSTAYEGFTTNGMNEQGLAAHVLGLADTDFGQRDDSKPGLLIVFWVQFYLDNFQTVDEAIRYTEQQPFQIVEFIHPKTGKPQFHIALEDATGDSAIFEYVNGQLHIYHGAQYPVLTNEPFFDQQLLNLQQYAGFGGDKPLPGTTWPKDRFVRASYYLSHLPESHSTRESIFNLFGLLRNAAQPFGLPTPERNQRNGTFETLWNSVSDLTNRVYYFSSTRDFNIIWINLDNFNLEAGAPVMRLDLASHQDLVGEVSTSFRVVNR